MWSQASKDRKSEYSEIAFLLERIHTAEQCFSTIFTPVLTGLYPQKFELTELYGKYIVACYDLAKFTHTTQLVTEELWEETLPEGSVENDYIASDRRIIEGLTPSSNSSSNYTSWAQHGKGSDYPAEQAAE